MVGFVLGWFPRSIGRRRERRKIEVVSRLLAHGDRDVLCSVERTRSGFRAHYAHGSGGPVFVGRRLRRDLEARLRGEGAVIVDEHGAQIDASQFEKEADPEFRKLRTDSDLPSLFLALLTPNWYRRWRHRRLLRQSSDDG